MKNIFVTNFDGSNEDVMLFTETWTVERVKERLAEKKKTYGEIYEVPDNEVRYYLYEPCYLN